jgi:hypothetical protein
MKNPYHSEHALVGYILAQQLQGEFVTLYYAFPSCQTSRSSRCLVSAMSTPFSAAI